ncbi:MAG TPA: PIN domain-containing protein [Woeseiaceae bacterium]|nr:PIN domain-containing protein [Woeseiaceae bacterium]
MKTWLIDTGPLVALLAGDDAQHRWAVETSKESPATVLTCDAVISEALFLLKRGGHRTEDLFALVEAGFLRSEFDFHAEYRHVRDLMRRYQDRPMAFADACLVRMAELRPEASIWTMDSDFRLYRKNRRQTLSLVMPEANAGRKKPRGR